MCLTCKLTAERKQKRESIYPSRLCFHWEIRNCVGLLQHSLMCTHCHQRSDSPLFSHILRRILLESYHVGVDKIGGPAVILTIRYVVYLQKAQNSASLHFLLCNQTQPAFEGVTRAYAYVLYKCICTYVCVPRNLRICAISRLPLRIPEIAHYSCAIS